MLASRRNGTLYVGVTNDLARRVSQKQQRFWALFPPPGIVRYWRKADIGLVGGE
jgi:predicted GIY-YIG superfamily endonuclease